ncbi:MAG: hypothetical protein ACYCTE_15805 [Acidimicrobiales bacterium]
MLKGGALTGAALVWAVPVVEVLTTATASATSNSQTSTPPGQATNLSWVDLVFVVPPSTEDGSPTYYLWSSSTGTFAANTDGFGNVSDSAFSEFDFYDFVSGKQAQLTGFTTPMPTDFAISSSIDASGDLTFTASGTPPTGLLLADVLVHGGAHVYDSSLTGNAVVAYGGSGTPDSASGPEVLDLSVPTGATSNLSGTVANDMQTATIDNSTYDLSYLVGLG